MQLQSYENLNLIGVNTEKDPKDAKKILRYYHNPLSTIFSDPKKSIIKKIGITDVPVTLLVDSNGRILQKITNAISNEDIKII